MSATGDNPLAPRHLENFKGALHLSLVESTPSSITFIFGVYVQMLCVPWQARGGHTALLEVGFLVKLGIELMSFDQWVCASTH